MISCPHCQAENEDNAKVCQRCEQALVAAPANDDLPLWLQALKPEGLAEGDMGAAASHDEAEDTVLAAPVEPTAAVATAPIPDAPTPPQHDEVEASAPTPTLAAPRPQTGGLSAAPQADTGGTDTVVATRPAPARRAAPVDAPIATKTRPAPAPAAPAPHQGTTDTASLISEDDLPAWLRAFSEPDTAAKETKADDQSWMTGSNGQADDQLSHSLAQSWQAPARAAAPPRTSAVSVFGVADEGRAKVTKVEKPERVIAATPAPAPAPAPEPKLSAPLPTVNAKQPVTPGRLGTNRAAVKGAERKGSAVQRWATIAFLVAFVIFLVVLGIFVVGPALMG